MGFMDKIRDFVSPEEDVEEEEIVETAAPKQAEPVRQNTAPRAAAAPAAPKAAPATQLVLYEPRSFGEAEEVGKQLKAGKATVINLHKLDKAFSQRTIDFLTGVVFALDGSIKKIGQNVILCYPAEIGVSGNINLDAPEAADDDEEDAA